MLTRRCSTLRSDWSGAAGRHDDASLDRAAAFRSSVPSRLNSNHPGAAHAIIHAYDDRERPAARSAPPRSTPGSPRHRAMRATCPRTSFCNWACGTRRSPLMKLPGRPRWRTENRVACEPAELDYHPLSWLVYEYVQQGRFDRARNALKPLEEALAGDPKPWMKNELATWRAYYIVGSERWTSSPDGRRSTTPTSCSHSAMPRRRRGAEKARATLDVMRKVAATDSEESRRELATIMERQLAALSSAAAGATNAALAAARTATELEDKTPLGDRTPASGEVLARALRRAAAADGQARGRRPSFERALTRTPNRSRAVLGLARAAAKSGAAAKSRAAYKQFLANWQLRTRDSGAG